jgi:hypothetical protein
MSINVKYLEAIVTAEKQGYLTKRNAMKLVLDEVTDAKIKAALMRLNKQELYNMKRTTAITLLIFWSVMMAATVYAVLN